MKNFLNNWWNSLRYEPNDPRYHGNGNLKIVAIGGGTGLPNLLRGLKKYSNQISAIVTVTDSGGSAGIMRKDFDMLAPGDVRRCISALAYDEELISKLLEHRFAKDKKTFGGHTLGNVWITALTDYYGSFEKAIEVTSEIFKTAGRVLPATLENVDLKIEYEDGAVLVGEHHLDEIVKKIKKISLTKVKADAYPPAIQALAEADLILIGPGSLYGSLIPNIMVRGVKEAIMDNKKAVKIYIANCSTERTQTCHFSIMDHIKEIQRYGGEKIVDYCLVNNNVIRTSKNEAKLGEINNITTDDEEAEGAAIVKADVIDKENPLLHDKTKLAKSIVELYNKAKSVKV